MKINFERILNSDEGKKLLSLIIGFGVATLFRRACHDKSCIYYQAPDLNKMENKISKYNDLCYQNTLEHVKCNNSLKNVYFEKPEN